tara:strand:- start:138 stop:347 length:210 start_codon:yes stop_codon:yes gene_type:complete
MAAHGVKVAISTGNTDNNANILERAPWNNGVVEEVEVAEIAEEVVEEVVEEEVVEEEIVEEEEVEDEEE